jgi:hypothetical protein
MTTSKNPERGKPPVRKKTSSIVYLVELAALDNRWNITRNGVPAAAFARDKGTAVGHAYQAASREQAATAAKVTVWSIGGGKRKKEWPATDPEKAQENVTALMR